MQRVLFADVIGKGTDPAVKCQLVKSWDMLAERKRVLKMRPKPKDQEVTKPEPKIKTVPIAEE